MLRIRRMLAASLAVLALYAVNARSQSLRWDGTSPFCDGSCNGNETEITRAAISPGSPPAYNGPQFGSACATGTKALCQASPGRSCRWDGTAPFCAGSCGGGETQAQPPAGSSSGRSCVTGSKAYCCREASAGVSSSPLVANPKLTLYAALWDKSASAPWQARNGLSSSEYQQEFDKLAAQGYRLVDVSGYAINDTDHYAAIWEKRQGPPWQARHGLTSAQYQEEFNKLVAQGFHPIVVRGYEVAGQDHYAAIWEQGTVGTWQARHGLSAADYQQTFDTLLRQGYHLVGVSGYNIGGQDRYAAIWQQGPSSPWQARHGLTSAQYQQEFNSLGQQGYRLAHVSGWQAGGVPHFAGIWVKEQTPAWTARHNMLSDTYQEEFNKLLADGYRLKDVSGYNTLN